MRAKSMEAATKKYGKVWKQRHLEIRFSKMFWNSTGWCSFGSSEQNTFRWNTSVTTFCAHILQHKQDLLLKITCNQVFFNFCLKVLPKFGANSYPDTLALWDFIKRQTIFKCFNFNWFKVQDLLYLDNYKYTKKQNIVYSLGCFKYQLCIWMNFQIYPFSELTAIKKDGVMHIWGKRLCTSWRPRRQ